MYSDIKVHKGDFMGGGTYTPPAFGDGFGTLRLRKGSMSVLGDKITKDMIQSIDVASEELSDIFGGKGNKVTFNLVLKDGRKILATTDIDAYQAIAATLSSTPLSTPKMETERKVSILLGVGILFMPIIFAWFTLREGYSKNVKILSFGWLIVGSILGTLLPKHDQGGTVVDTQPQKQLIASTETAKEVNPVNQETSHRDNRIPKDVFQPYDKENYPKLIKKYKKRLDDVQKYRVKAAEMVLASGKCDKIFMSELSDESTVKNLKFFVDCSSGKQDRRIYLTEGEIVKNAPVVAQDEKGLDETEATMMCKKEIEAKSAEYPKVTTHEIAGTAVHKYPQSGRVEVHMDFEITNFYGVEIPYVGHCFFDEDGNGTIKIQRRSGAG